MIWPTHGGGSLDSWESFSAGYEVGDEINAAMQADFESLSFAMASEYFSVVNSALKKRMPNHLYFGCRFADWGMTPESVRAAAKHTDVVSYNMYTEGLPGQFGTLLAEVDRPSVLGEFHFGALDVGMFHGGIVTASDQRDRGKKYQVYMKSVIDNPYFVGAHWFQYIDSPVTGRVWDGENYNTGFVSVTDRPYQELVDAAKELNNELYKLRFSR